MPSLGCYLTGIGIIILGVLAYSVCMISIMYLLDTFPRCTKTVLGVIITGLSLLLLHGIALSICGS